MIDSGPMLKHLRWLKVKLAIFTILNLPWNDSKLLWHDSKLLRHDTKLLWHGSKLLWHDSKLLQYFNPRKVGFKIAVVIYPGIFITLARGNVANEE